MYLLKKIIIFKNYYFLTILSAVLIFSFVIFLVPIIASGAENNNSHVDLLIKELPSWTLPDDSDNEVFSGQERVLLGRYDFEAKSGNINLTSISITSDSLSLEKYFTNFRLYRKIENITNTQISGPVFSRADSKSVITFNLDTALVIAAGKTENLFITVDVLEDASGGITFAGLKARAKKDDGGEAKISEEGNFSTKLLISRGGCRDNRAVFVSQQGAPTKIAAGENFTAVIKMENTGCSIWKERSSNPYWLSSVNPRDNSYWGKARFAATTEVKPNEIGTFIISAKAPENPGNYNFQWQMGQEIVEKFGDLTPAVLIEVTPSIATTELQELKERINHLGIKMSTEEKNFILAEKKLTRKIDNNLTQAVKGRVLLQIQDKGQSWYVDPVSEERYYLKDHNSAFNFLKIFGLGITNEDIAKIPESTATIASANKDQTGLVDRLEGRILIQVEDNGKAWYVHDGKRYYMANGWQALEIMNSFSLGITNENLRKIKIGEIE